MWWVTLAFVFLDAQSYVLLNSFLLLAVQVHDQSYYLSPLLPRTISQTNTLCEP